MTIEKTDVDNMIYLITCSIKEELGELSADDLRVIPVFSLCLEDDLIKIQKQYPSWKIIGIQNLDKMKKQVLILENFKRSEVLPSISKK